jgi:FPC/CPF motif-containing protein YcgG
MGGPAVGLILRRSQTGRYSREGGARQSLRAALKSTSISFIFAAAGCHFICVHPRSSAVKSHSLALFLLIQSIQPLISDESARSTR